MRGVSVQTKMALALTAIALAGCGGSATGVTDTGSQGPVDSFVAACEGGSGSSLEAHCECIENAVEGTESESTIQGALSDISAGNPPTWYMNAALGC